MTETLHVNRRTPRPLASVSTVVASIAVSFLSACGGGGGGGGTSPVPQPSATPTIAPLNYLPFDNSAGFEGAPAGGGYQSFNPAVLAAQNSIASSAPNCAASVSTMGDFSLAGTFPALVADSTAMTSAAANHVTGQTPVYLLTKDAAGNVYIDGYYFGVNNVKKCVTPYVFVKSQMKAGDTWVYTDINGSTQTASVQYAGQPASFTVGGNGPHSGTTTNYPNVSQVNYGSTFTVYWAAGYGPAQTVNIGQPASEPFPPTWTAYGYTTVPTSR